MVTVDLSEERRLRRRAGNPRVTEADRELMRRVTTGDLADEFQAALDSDLANDPNLAEPIPTTNRAGHLSIDRHDEYLAARVIFGNWPQGLPDDDLALPASRHWRLLQRIHRPGKGQLSTILAGFSKESLDAVRFPRPEVLQVLDTRVLLDERLRSRPNTVGVG